MISSVNDNIPEECCSCGTKTPLDHLNHATSCEYFICSACATYHKLPWTLGYLCDECYHQQRSGSIKEKRNLH